MNISRFTQKSGNDIPVTIFLARMAAAARKKNTVLWTRSCRRPEKPNSCGVNKPYFLRTRANSRNSCLNQIKTSFRQYSWLIWFAWSMITAVIGPIFSSLFQYLSRLHVFPTKSLLRLSWLLCVPNSFFFELLRPVFLQRVHPSLLLAFLVLQWVNPIPSKWL